MSAGRALSRSTSGGREYSHVLGRVLLDGGAARLAAALDPAFLDEAGWDPAGRVLDLPAGHRLLGRAVCAASECENEVFYVQAGVCSRCFTRLTKLGMTAGQIGQAGYLPPAPGRTADCAVPGCRREPAWGSAALCHPHVRQSGKMQSPALEQFLADPRVRPLGPAPGCAVTACTGLSRSRGFCPAHYQRWRKAVQAGPGLDTRTWTENQQPSARGGLVRMHGLAPLVTVQVLAGLQQRTRDGARTFASDLRMACRALASQQVPTIAECDIGAVPGARSVRPLLRVLARYARLALSDPASEQAADTWDLAVFGHSGCLDFTGITQRWLRESARHWAAHDLPRRRGKGASNVRAIVSSAARLPESLRTRPDRGEQPGALGRRDIESFLSRLAYLETAGTISRCQRTIFCRGARTVLTAVRERGLARPGQPAAGLPGDVALALADIPALPERGEPGRDLPAEIMTALCGALGTLPPGEIRTGVEIVIDTGRRPAEVASLPLDCLTRDADGRPVLIYGNLKAHRQARRQPVSERTAAVIIAQQNRVTARFPASPRSEPALLPSPKRNPGGRRHIGVDWLEDQHRDWADGLGDLRAGDGTGFDSAKIVLYAYRHTFAQRHADAGVPIDVLAALMDHKNLDVTRGYYRVGEGRRRDAVDKVTAMSFDRHGNRTWRDARDLLDAGHARYAIGQVAVPYGTCTEPANVAAAGGACPVRFRCTGCDHFRTDVSCLPDLTAHLDDLLRTRERLAAMSGVDDWARAASTPPEEEITRIRRLTAQIEGDITQLTADERAGISEAVTTIRKHRAVNLGMPAIRTRTTAQEETA